MLGKIKFARLARALFRLNRRRKLTFIHRIGVFESIFPDFESARIRMNEQQYVAE